MTNTGAEGRKVTWKKGDDYFEDLTSVKVDWIKTDIDEHKGRRRKVAEQKNFDKKMRI